MKAIVRISLGAALGLLSFACSGGNPPGAAGTAGTGGGPAGTTGTGGTTGDAGTTGTGGTTGDGGTTGTGGGIGTAGTTEAGGTTGGTNTGRGGGQAGGRGGTGGSDPTAPLELPGCLRDLIAPCAPLGTCVAEPGSACFETGARVSSSSGSNSGTCTHSASVSKADGTLCYTYQWTALAGQACEIQQHTWKDAAGNVVATAWSRAYPDMDVTVTCSATGDVAMCGTFVPNSCCAISPYGTAACTAARDPSHSCTAGTCAGGGGTGGSGGSAGSS